MADTDNLHALIYRSQETAPLSSDDLKVLLESSRRKNERLSITGILIYGGGVFAQYLEGSKSNIDSLFASITKDNRHQDVWMMAAGPITDRAFPEWSMSYRDVTADIVHMLPGALDPAEALRKTLDIPSASMMTVLLKSLVQTLLPEQPVTPPSA
ncbi:MAG: BLUF domain-containing protein [Rhodospirillales bacterium]